MERNLGWRTKTGVLSAANRVTSGAWVVEFRPADFGLGEIDFEIYHAAARGPGGYFLTYVDDAFYGSGRNGLVNEYSPTIAQPMRRGQSWSAHWSVATGSAPTVTLFMRLPEGVFNL